MNSNITLKVILFVTVFFRIVTFLHEVRVMCICWQHKVAEKNILKSSLFQSHFDFAIFVVNVS